MKLVPNDWRRQADPIPTPTRINLGPLTTVFVPPTHCTRAAIAGADAILGQSCNPEGASATAADDTGCWPRATAYPSAAKSSLGGMGFYSPGVMCPTGYYSACTAVSTSKGQTAAAPQVTGKFQFPLVAGETAVGCCPTGYACAASGGAQSCHQVATQTSFDAMTCEGSTGRNLDGFRVPGTMGGEAVATMDLWAPMIQINHMATDLPESSSTREAGASRSRTRGSATSTATATATEAAVEEGDVVGRANNTEAEEATRKTQTRTQTSARASATQTDDEVVRVKDTGEESSSKTFKTASGKATITDAPVASPTPTLDLSSTNPAAVGAAAGPAAPEDILIDTRQPPSLASTLFPVPATVTSAGATSTALSSEQSQSSFSAGAKVGVAVGPVAGAALILLGVLYYKRRRQNANTFKEGDAKSILSDSTGPGSGIYQNTYFGGSRSNSAMSKSHDMGDGYPSSVRSSPYNADCSASEIAMNGLGPSIIAPSSYRIDTNKMTPADFYANPWSEKDEYETRPFETVETTASPFTHAHKLSVESGSIESPIDGTSPFRLKRGNTLKGRAGASNNDRHVSVEGVIGRVSTEPDADDHDHARSSNESVEWGDKGTLQRSTSFSRPRPRPKTAASSLYPDDRDSIISWNSGSVPDMPQKPLPSIPKAGGLDRSKSFSRPRPRRDGSEDTLVEGRSEVPAGVVPPPVTMEGVSF